MVHQKSAQGCIFRSFTQCHLAAWQELHPAHCTMGTNQCSVVPVPNLCALPPHCCFRAVDSLKLSSLAISTTVGNPDRRSDDAVEAAVIHSITHGWNVIDTGGVGSMRLAHVGMGVGDKVGRAGAVPLRAGGWGRCWSANQ